MTALLVCLCLLSLMTLVCGVLVLFQRWEDRDGLDSLRRDVKTVLALQNLQRQDRQQEDEMVGQTWLPTSGDQARVEALLRKQGLTRQHARTGSDPFGSNANLAP